MKRAVSGFVSLPGGGASVHLLPIYSKTRQVFSQPISIVGLCPGLTGHTNRRRWQPSVASDQTDRSRRTGQVQNAGRW